MPELLVLFLEFFKVGLFAVGGGLATLPFLYELADKYDWFTSAQLTDMIAISESTPGPIGINCATYAGYSAHGVIGAITATCGIVCPALIIGLFVVKFIEKYKENKYLNSAFAMIRPAANGMIAAAGILVMQEVLISKDLSYYVDLRLLALFAVFFVAMRKIKWHPIFFIIIAGFLGAALSL